LASRTSFKNRAKQYGNRLRGKDLADLSFAIVFLTCGRESANYPLKKSAASATLKMILTPAWPENSSDVCEGIRLYQAGRPPLTPAFLLGNWIAFWTVISLSLASICWFYFAREEPRLRTVRPLSLSVLQQLAHILIHVGLLLNLAILNLPCALLAGCILFGLAGYGTHGFVRMMAFIVESQFALNAVKLQVTLDDSQSETTFQTTTSGIFSSFSAVKSLAKLSLGLCNLQDVPLQDLVIAKRSWLTIASIVMFPSIIPFFIVLIVEPQYQQCTGCPIFLEVVFIYVPVLSIYILAAGRMLYVAWKFKFPDKHGLIIESYWIAFGTAAPSGLGWLLIIADPNNVEYYREFMFEWVMVFFLFLYWFVCVPWQAFMIYRSRIHRILPRTRVGLDPTWSSDVDFLAILREDPGLKEEFQTYAIQHYCVENLYFVEGVAMYKRYFTEKGETWRRQKAKMLYEIYIRDGGNLEVNISSSTRMKLQAKYDAIVKGTDDALSRDLHDLFDNAVDDIVRNVLGGVWIQFQMERKKNAKRKTTSRIVQNGIVSDSTVSSTL
jgi:hypothetical protein